MHNHQENKRQLGLTARETEILSWIAAGKTNQEIAGILGISFFTVKAHVARILDRLGVENRTAAAVFAAKSIPRRPAREAAGVRPVRPGQHPKPSNGDSGR